MKVWGLLKYGKGTLHFVAHEHVENSGFMSKNVYYMAVMLILVDW